MEEEGEVRYMDGDDTLSSKCSLPCLALRLSQIILSTPVQILVFCLFPANGNSTLPPISIILAGVEPEGLVQIGRGSKGKWVEGRFR